MTELAPQLEETVEIGASAQQVWDLIHDVRRMPEWSPQVQSVRLRGGAGQIAVGVEFTNLNRHDDLTWTTHGEITVFEPGERIAFRISENWTTWSFQLEPVSQTVVRLTQRRDAPDGISEYSRTLTDTYLGGEETFTELMRDGMRRTLAAVRLAAEHADTVPGQ